MTLSISPPGAVLVVGIGIFAVVAASAVRREGSVRIRLITVAAAAVMIGGLLVFIYRPKSITVDAAGISATSGGKLAIPWTDVSESHYVSDLQGSRYRTTSRISGVALGPYEVGVFKTAGAGKVRIIAQQQKSALVVKAGDSLYEFAPEQVERMVVEVAKHVSVAGWPRKR